MIFQKACLSKFFTVVLLSFTAIFCSCEAQNLADFEQTILTAKDLETRHTMYDQSKSASFRAYEQALSKGPKIKQRLLRMFPKASPAGKFYIVMLLYKISPKDGLAALKSLSSDNSKVRYRRGCIGDMFTVARLAARFQNKLPQNYLEN